MRSITLRLAGPEDDAALAHIAARDTRPVPPAPVLLAERDGEPLAARSLANGATVADPFAPTAELVEMLAVAVRHAAQPPRGVRREAESRRPAARLALGTARW